MTSKVIPGLAVSLVSFACLSAPTANALQITVDGSNYDVTAFIGTYNNNASSFAPALMPWFGSEATALSFASTLQNQLGLGIYSPKFAYNISNDIVYIAHHVQWPSVSSVVFRDTSYAYAIATLVPASSNSVPGPLPLFGAAGAFAWSRRLRSRVSALSSSADPL
jgi:hypothetical protein